jgi:hypothetical protein
MWYEMDGIQQSCDPAMKTTKINGFAKASQTKTKKEKKFTEVKTNFEATRPRMTPRVRDNQVGKRLNTFALLFLCFISKKQK